MDPNTMQGWGVSTDSARINHPPKKHTPPIIVAVIDGGIDTSHPDIRPNLWINTKEIAGNNLDDDNNGYADDVYGWNFIGGKDGEVGPENTEAVRLYNKLQSRFKHKELKEIPKQDRSDFELFKKVEKKILLEKLDAEQNLATFEKLKKQLDKIVSLMGDEDFTSEEVRSIQDKDEEFMQVVEGVANALENQVEFNKIYTEVMDGYKYYFVSAYHHYNPAFDGRSVVGDDPDNMNDINYGNNNVTGPDSEHGTHVAGIIGAVRENGMGIDGIASNVRIMAIRAVPDGDERDKDIANAIRYAVDNGARIINMSFGKSFSPNKDAVDSAIAYAASKNVLMVHAAGNDSENMDKEHNYPNPRNLIIEDKYFPWIEVGASNIIGQPAGFSNYGSKIVDLFAPGESIYSTMPGGQYDYQSGTSMAAPVVSGIAALLWSAYPEATAKEIKVALVLGTITTKDKVIRPGTEKKIKFRKLSKTGGIANANKSGNALKYLLENK